MSRKNHLRVPLFLVGLLTGFPQISETIYSPALPTIAHWYGVSAGLIEMSLMTYFVGFAIGVGLWGWLADIYGRRPVMLAGLILCGLTCIFLAHAQTAHALLVLRVIQALGASVGSVITMTMLRDTLSGSERGRAFSFISATLVFVPAIGPWLGGYLTVYLGWQSNFMALALMGFILFLCCLYALPETQPETAPGERSRPITSVFMRMLTDTRLWGHVLLIGAAKGLVFGFYAEGPFLFMDQLGMGTQQFGWLGLLISASTLLSAWVSYQLQSRVDIHSIIHYGTLGIACVALLLFLNGASGVIHTQMGILALTGMLAGLGFLFFCLGLVIPNSLSIALNDYEADVGTAGALFGVGYYVLLSLFMWLISAMHSGSVLTLFQFNAIMAAILTGGNYLILYQTPGTEYN